MAWCNHWRLIPRTNNSFEWPNLRVETWNCSPWTVDIISFWRNKAKKILGNNDVKFSIWFSATLTLQHFAFQDQGVVFYVLKAIVTLAYPYPPPQMISLCGSLLDIVIAVMKLFPSEARVQVGWKQPATMMFSQAIPDWAIGFGMTHCHCKRCWKVVAMSIQIEFTLW